MSEVKLQVGVKVFLKNKEGNFLLLRRNSDKYHDVRGRWDIVGGRIEAGSKLLDNLRREVREETELEITSEPKLIYAQDIIPNAEKHVVRLTYVAETVGEPTLDTSENVEYKWLSIDEMKSQGDLDIYVKEIIDRGFII